MTLLPAPREEIWQAFWFVMIGNIFKGHFDGRHRTTLIWYMRICSSWQCSATLDDKFVTGRQRRA